MLNKMNLKESVDMLICECNNNYSASGNFPYYQSILKILEQIKIGENLNYAQRRHIVGGLIRIITDDFTFAESSLGDKLVDFSNEYLNME
jgi:hypothetical protein